MLKLIKTDYFFLTACAKTVELFDCRKDDYHTNCCPKNDCELTESLNSQMLEAAAVENTRLNIEKTISQGTPDTVCKVNADCTNRVIDVALQVKAFNYDYYEETSNDTDDCSAESVNCGTRSRDCNQTGERSVQSH